MRRDGSEPADDRSWHQEIDRDWKSVAVGGAIVASVALFELPIPW